MTLNQLFLHLFQFANATHDGKQYTILSLGNKFAQRG